VAGIIIPYRGKVKAIYERANLRRIDGIPVIAFAGIGTLIYFVLLSYALITNPIFGVNSPQSLLAIAAFWIIGMAIGSIFYYHRKSHGINIGKAFEEIPPE